MHYLETLLEDDSLWPSWGGRSVRVTPKTPGGGERVVLAVHRRESADQDYERALSFVCDALGYTPLQTPLRTHYTLTHYDIEYEPPAGDEEAWGHIRGHIAREMDRALDLVEAAVDVVGEAQRGRTGLGAYPHGDVPAAVKREFETISGQPWSEEMFEAWEKLRPLSLMLTLGQQKNGRYAVHVVDLRTQTPIPADEPVFVILGRDVYCPDLISYYIDNCAANEAQRKSLLRHLKKVREWQTRNPDRVKNPD